jgi:hypothetical protein
MLQAVAGLLLHQYAMPAFQAGPDLQWLCMSPVGATAYNNVILAKISAANTNLFGASAPPSKLYLLHNTVDVLCCDVDAMKQSLAAPELRVQASVGAAAHAVLSALQSVAAVAAANARSDEAIASRAAQTAAAAAQSALKHAQQLQVLGVNAATTTRLSANIPLPVQQAAETLVACCTHPTKSVEDLNNLRGVRDHAAAPWQHSVERVTGQACLQGLDGSIQGGPATLAL